MDEPQSRTYRYERKFLVSELDAQQVRLLVRRHPAMFHEPYPPRHVNNLYLDTEELENYYENVGGVGERHKVRIRWYGELFGEIHKPVLEFKVKSGLVGTKHAYPLPAFRLEPGFGRRDFQRMLRAADLPDHTRLHLRSLDLVLCNRYYRWYYASRDRRFRVTVDSAMTYYGLRRERNRFLQKYTDDAHVVVELKYEKPLDAVADRVAGFFPFSVSRNSKYITGIDLVYL